MNAKIHNIDNNSTQYIIVHNNTITSRLVAITAGWWQSLLAGGNHYRPVAITLGAYSPWPVAIPTSQE